MEYISDSGAGKPVYSDRAFQELRINPKEWRKFLRESKRPMLFETGGGVVAAFNSLAILGQLLSLIEAYQLDDAPLCMPMGDIVQRQRMAFIWISGLTLST